MAPPTQRKRKGKGHVGESSSAAIDEDKRFINEKAVESYGLLMTKSMPRERGFDMEHAKRPLTAQLVSRHWKNIIKPPTEAVIPIVREFYANLRVSTGKYSGYVRGEKVSFDCYKINRLYNLPNIENDEYTAFQQGPIEFDEIIAYLCYPGAVWKLNQFGQVMNFPARHLKQAASAVFLFVIARLMPAKHATDVTKDRAILIYSILKGHSLDVGQLISASILYAATRKMNISLPHSSLITELCQSAGVEWDKEEEVLKLQNPIKVPTRQVMEADDLPTARATGNTSQQAREIHQPHQRSINQRLDDLEHKFDNLSTSSSVFMNYVVDFNTSLAHRFTHPQQPHPPFPDPPVWQNEDEEEGEEEQNEEEDDNEH